MYNDVLFAYPAYPIIIINLQGDTVSLAWAKPFLKEARGFIVFKTKHILLHYSIPTSVKSTQIVIVTLTQLNI